ncbi:DegV family protein [Oceanirhabdus sp. W0125-5]|uniref:DegV family protein n=1 Tax=Oceanirhabdus sp. W0125-5 TaxID=2999116 RepID=UPI0022F33C42|nr:DegV family protein [Oceanirhabdus sp. W0125-5]WBW99730.1 DegV family protein [Oceanirhabdus sp. W0125-5]
MLLVDSCSDLPLEFIENNLNIIDTIGMSVNIDGKDYYDDFGKTLSHKEFYGYLRQGIMPKTAAINSYSFLEKFKKHHEKGYSLIYLGFTSGLSGTFNNAVMAKEMFLEEHPDADITVIDTKSASVGEGVLVIHAVEMIRKGHSKEEVIKWIQENKMKSNHWFAVNDLNFLKKGGRLSATKAAVGTILNVKPILTVDDQGELKPYTSVRGRKKSMKFIYDKLVEHMTNPEETIVVIGHGDCLNDAIKIEKYINKHLKLKKVIVTELCSTIASHVGPDMISLAFIGEGREN